MASFRPELARVLSQLSLLRLSTREVIDLYDLLNRVGPIEFSEMLRHLHFLTMNATGQIDLPIRYRGTDERRSNVDSKRSTTLDSLHKKVVSIQKSAGIDNEALCRVIAKNIGETSKRTPRFDKKKGLKSWLGELLKIATASQIYRAALLIKPDTGDLEKMSWPLSKK